MKQCLECGEIKPNESFYWKRKGKTREAVCKSIRSRKVRQNVAKYAGSQVA